MSIGLESFVPPGARIKVVGVGGGGGNAVNTMIRNNIEGVEFVVCNTDMQSLRFSLAPHKIQIGKELTRGLGAGADPDIGREAALEDRHEIQELLAGSDMVFITAGMGGGTGTGAAAVVAQIARELGALTVAVVTKPFGFEGKRRKKHADLGVGRLRECVDTLITIPNQRLLQVAHPGLSMVDAFKMADAVLVNAVRGINDIINIPGIINVDFADVKTIMSCMGQALMGIGSARGESRAVEAARMAISSPLLEDIDIEGATGILINITAGSDLTLMEVNEACSIIQEAAHEDANIIFGSVIDENLGDQINVTVIATGFPVDTSEETGESPAKAPQQPITYTSRLTTPSIGAAAKPAQRPAAPSYVTRRPEAPRAAAPQGAPQTAKEGKLENFEVAAPLAPEAPVAAYQPAPQAPLAASAVIAQEPAVTLPQIPTEPEVLTPAVDPGLDEARLLADWTLESAQGLAPGELEEFPSLAHPSLAAPSLPVMDAAVEVAAAEPEVLVNKAPAQDEPMHDGLRLAGASVIQDPQDDFSAVAHAVFAPDDDALRFLAEAPKLVGATARDEEAPAMEAAAPSDELMAPAPLDSFFDDEGALIAGEIDRKIDEALELAQRMKAGPQAKVQAGEAGDDLDVPAFLRQGMKDLPLG